MGLTVSLSLRIKTSDRKRKYCKPAWTGKRKDRLLALYAEIDGKAVWHPEGIYCLRFEVNGRRQWETVGKNPAEALDRLAERQKWLRQASWQTQPETSSSPGKPNYLLKETLQKYIANVANLKSSKTASAYRFTLEQFSQVSRKERLNHVDRQDLNDFAKWLRERGSSDRTVHNRIGQVVTFLRAHDVKDVTISYKFTEKKVKAYREAELKALFEACPDEEWITKLPAASYFSMPLLM